MSRPLSDTVCGKYDMPTMCLYEKNCARFDICLRKHVVAATRPPHLRLETISARNGPCPVSRKPPPESSVPGETLPRGSRRNQLRRGHGSPPVLSEVPHELSTAAHSKECKRSPQQFIPAGFPLHDQLPTGTEDSAIPLTTPDMVRSGRVLQPQLNLHYAAANAPRVNSNHLQT